MKTIIRLMLTIPWLAFGGDLLRMEPGRTNDLMFGIRVFYVSAESSNLYGVILYETDGAGSTNRIMKCDNAYIGTDDAGMLVINLKNVTITQRNKDGQTVEIKADSMPVRFGTASINGTK